MLTTGMLVFGKVIACVFTADLLSGFLHWLEDAYGREHWPVRWRPDSLSSSGEGLWIWP